MNVISLLALIGLILIFGISEIVLCKFFLGHLSQPFVVLILSIINFLIILFIIRRQPQRTPSLEPVEGIGLEVKAEALEKQ